MTPIEYCYQKAAIPGSALYFSARHLDPLMRDALVTVCAFYKEIEEATLHCKETSVAQTKLNWWRRQITKIGETRVDHPIAIMLQTLIPSFSLNPLHFISIIDGLEQNLCRTLHNSFEEVVVHIMRTAGTREFLIATLLQQNEMVEQATIYQFALVLELVNYLQHYRKYASCGYYLLSKDELDQFKIPESDLVLTETSPGMKLLFQYRSETIENAYQKAFEALKPALYGTTKTFLDHFNLKSLDQLPTLAELKDLDSQEAKLQVQLELPNQESALSESADETDSEFDVMEEDESFARESGKETEMELNVIEETKLFPPEDFKHE